MKSKGCNNMLITVHKSTLGQWNAGVCRSANNASFKGVTPCWVISLDGEEVIGFKTKRDAVRCQQYAIMSQWVGRGDIVGLWLESNPAHLEQFRGEC